MTNLIRGLHHVTATVTDAQKDLDFYVTLLGLRLVKKTVNFDNHNVYHFYYGNERGAPSTLTKITGESRNRNSAINRSPSPNRGSKSSSEASSRAESNQSAIITHFNMNIKTHRRHDDRRRHRRHHHS